MPALAAHCRRFLISQRVSPRALAMEVAMTASRSIRNAAPAMEQSNALTISDFCKSERISLSTYHKLKKLGFGPDEIRIPGLSYIRISADAYGRWREKINSMQNSHELNQERERRSAFAKAAGNAAARSPLHVSKRLRRAEV